MKILVICQYFYPENFRINELCFELVQRGHEVTVLTGLPNYPSGYIYEGYEDMGNTIEYVNGVRVIRCHITPRKKDVIHLMLNYLSFAFYAKKKIKKLHEGFDLTFVYQLSPILQVYPAKYFKKKYNCPMIINCQDLWPESIRVYGIKKDGLIYKMVKIVSKKLYQSADVIAISSPGFENYLKKLCCINKEKIKYLPNFAEDFYLNFNDCEHIDKKLHLLFAGNIGKAQDLMTIVKAVELLSDEEKENLIIDIVGDGSYMDTLKNEIDQRKLSKYFIFHGRKDSKELQNYYERASACLLTLEGNSPVGLTIPTKLQGYMGAAKPVLAAIDGGAKEVIEQSKCGQCVCAGDFLGFNKLLKNFIKDPIFYKKLGNNGREYFIENFLLSKYIDNLEKMMEELKCETKKESKT